MKKLLFAALALTAFGCSKPKIEDTCKTDTRIVGTWAQDSLIEYNVKYYTPYSNKPNTAQTRVVITSSTWTNQTHTTEGTTTINSSAISLNCDKVKFDGVDGYSFTIVHDSILQTTESVQGYKYFYHLIK
jgi:hypothetical protein